MERRERLTHAKALEAMTAIAEAGFEACARTWALSDSVIVYQIGIRGRLQGFEDGRYCEPDIAMVEKMIAVARSLALDLTVGDGGRVSYDDERGHVTLALPSQESAERTKPSGLPWPPVPRGVGSHEYSVTVRSRNAEPTWPET